MNTDNLVSALEKFFFEIIGQLLPGTLLLIGFYYILPTNVLSDFVPSNSFGYWVFVGCAYAFGGALTALGSYIFIPIYLKIVTSAPFSWLIPKTISDVLITNKEVDLKLTQSPSYKHIQSLFPEGTPLRTLRNVAMSSIDAADKETTVRFMFLSLLSQGVSTAIFVIAITHTIILFFSSHPPLDYIIYLMEIIAITTLISFPFVLREREFYDRARRLPLDSYFTRLQIDTEQISASKTLRTVYLSGGHYSGWQDKVANKIKGFNYIDPSKNGFSDPKLYTQWDLDAIRSSDIIFAYFERQNPSGYGLSLEIGYATALNKMIILVDEKSSDNPSLERYLKILRESSNAVFDSFDEGVNYLGKLVD